MPSAAASEVSHQALQDGAAPTPARLSMGDLGQAGGREALDNLTAAIRELKALAAAPLLQRAINCLNGGDFKGGCKWALKALDKDDRSGVGWYLLGIGCERAGDFQSSLRAYEAALKLLPDHGEVANHLGRLAHRMGMLEQAEKLFRHSIVHAPEQPEGFNNLASVLKDLGRADEALEILRTTTLAHPESAILWNTLGTVVLESGDLATADTFFGEAWRLNPTFGKALYNMSQARLHMGLAQEALEHVDQAMQLIREPDDLEMLRMARSSYLLCLGRLGEGWDAYEARLAPQFADVTVFHIKAPRWEPGADLSGKTLLVCAEQGLGDEVLFSNVLPDVVDKLGPDGKLQLAVERRLVPLYERSFPNAKVMTHKTYLMGGRPVRLAPDLDEKELDLWTPIASLLREFRREVSDFPAQGGYLKADPKRVAHWKRLLETAPPGRKVGLLWKSAISANARSRFYSPFARWAAVLNTPGVTFVNLQYGDCAEELEQAKRDFGIDIWSPPEIDLKNDLDDLAALCCAMDLMIGFSNATLNIGAACGAPAWLISLPGAWPRLGQSDTYPWYPGTRVFAPEQAGDWDGVMAKVADALGQFAGTSER